MNHISEFIQSYFLWKEALLAGAITGAVCGFLGIYVVIRRIIFVSAALTQISSLGVALAFYIEGINLKLFQPLANPFVLSLLLTILASYIFGLKRNYLRISQEGIIGAGFLIASSGVVIIGDKITKGAHDVADIIFGAAVVVEMKELYIIIAVALIVALLHWRYFKDFIFISYDSELPRLFGYPVRYLHSVLLVSIGIIIAVATRALGALPVFAFLALPSLSALILTERLHLAFLLSAILGLISAIIGYFLSFVFDLPTGATISTTASVIFVLSYVLKKH